MSCFKTIKGTLSHLHFSKYDLNGFFQLFFDNASTILLLVNLLLNVVWVAPNMSDQSEDFSNQVNEMVTQAANTVIWEKILPGLALSMIYGNLFYAYQACRLSYREDRYGDVSALPYGINTPSSFGFVFSILLPSFMIASSNCIPNGDAEEYGQCLSDAISESWSTGVVSVFISGVFCIILAFFGNVISKVTPIGALLTSLATIAFSFLLMAGIGKAWTYPISGVIPFVLLLVGYLSGVSFEPIPTALVIVFVGTVLGWSNQVVTGDDVVAASQYVKWNGISTGFSAFSVGFPNIASYIGVIFPLALQGSCGSLMNVHSAAAAGDKYPLRQSMIADGIGSIIGSCFGSVFCSTIYIGHPSYKKIKAGMGYSVINAGVIFITAIFGLFAIVNAVIPNAAITPVISFVGLIICKEALDSMPNSRHVFVFILGIIPGVCDWAMQGGFNFGTLGDAFFGYVALGKSSILFALILTSIAYFILDRNYTMACGWSFGAAVCASIGLIHQSTISFTNYLYPGGSYCVSKSDLGLSVNATSCPTHYMECADDPDFCGWEYGTKWRFMTSYLMLCALCLIMHFLQTKKMVPQKIVDVKTDGKHASSAANTDTNEAAATDLDDDVAAGDDDDMSTTSDHENHKSNTHDINQVNPTNSIEKQQSVLSQV